MKLLTIIDTILIISKNNSKVHCVSPLYKKHNSIDLCVCVGGWVSELFVTNQSSSMLHTRRLERQQTMTTTKQDMIKVENNSNI